MDINAKEQRSQSIAGWVSPPSAVTARTQILVEGLEFVGRHGVYEEERRDGRAFRVDLTVDVDTRPAARSAELGDALDYCELAQIILEIGKGPSVVLIETLSHQMVDTILDRFPSVSEVQLRLRKFATGVPGEPQSVGTFVHKTRERSIDVV